MPHWSRPRAAGILRGAIAGPGSASFVLSPEDRRLVDALRAGDEAAFASLVTKYSPSLLRLALAYVGSRAVAEEVVQETWLGVLRGLDRFEGRSSLKTWLFRILANTAKTRAEREARTVPFSALGGKEGNGPHVEPGRFLGPDHPSFPGHWREPPASWDDVPEQRLLSGEVRRVIEEAVEALPPRQRAVLSLRDIEGFGAEETCNVLGLSETNQRVLLHRARSRVRAALERYLATEPGAP